LGVLMSFTNSPNMGLPVPTVGNEIGPNYAFDVNAALTILDQHNHAPGSGVQINPAGLNINSNLSFNDNAATNLMASVYTVQPSLATLQAVYVKGVDLYYNDSNGNVIQLTASGSPAGGAGSITGLPSGTAGVAYSAGTYTFSQSTNTPANIQVASVLLGNPTPLSNYLTLSPPAAMGANSNITLPYVPSIASQSFMTIDTSGNIGASIAVSGGITNSNIAVGTIQGSRIAAATILGSNIASATITGSNIAASTVAVSNMATITQASNTGAVYSNNTSTFTSIVTTFYISTNNGRPLFLFFSGGGVTLTDNMGGVSYSFRIQDTFNNVTIAEWSIPAFDLNSSVSGTISIPASSFNFMGLGDGTGSYALQARCNGAGGSVSVPVGMQLNIFQV
jgi:hypothetical protein